MRRVRKSKGGQPYDCGGTGTLYLYFCTDQPDHESVSTAQVTTSVGQVGVRDPDHRSGCPDRVALHHLVPDVAALDLRLREGSGSRRGTATEKACALSHGSGRTSSSGKRSATLTTASTFFLDLHQPKSASASAPRSQSFASLPTCSGPFPRRRQQAKPTTTPMQERYFRYRVRLPLALCGETTAASIVLVALGQGVTP